MVYSGMTVAVRIRPFDKKKTEVEEDESCVKDKNKAEEEVDAVADDECCVSVEERTPKKKKTISMENNKEQELEGEPEEAAEEYLLRVTSSGSSSVFRFDHLFWNPPTSSEPETSQQQVVFEEIGSPLVKSALEGYNCTLFAYGQTGAGKTHTMLGELPRLSADVHSIEDAPNAGIIPRVCHALISQSEDGNRSTSFSFTISYVEIFLEKVRDLLIPPNASASNKTPPNRTSTVNLKVREHPSDGPFVEGATVVPVSTDDDFLALLKLGDYNRHTASTKMNEQSSRSHAVLTLTCTQRKQVASGQGDTVDTTIVSKINLVDLAGSENARSSGSIDQSMRLKEGAAINKSLLALGRVIKMLAENATSSEISTREEADRRSTVGVSHSRRPSSEMSDLATPSSSSRRSSLPGSTAEKRRKTPPRQGVVPYRDSVLTYLLRESLGGNAKTTMIAAVRPGVEFADETMNTLKYAAQARKIVNCTVVNENPYMKIIRQLQEEVAMLSKKLAKKESIPIGLDEDSTPDATTMTDDNNDSNNDDEDEDDESEDPQSRLQELQEKMTLAMRSDEAIRNSQTPESASKRPSNSSYLWQNLALELELEEVGSDDSCSSQDCNVASVMDGGDGAIDRNTLEEINSKLVTPLQSSPPLEASSDDLDVHAHPVIVSTDPPLKYVPKKGEMAANSKKSSDYYHQNAPPLSEVIKEGFLLKKGFVNPAFKRRWCVLRGQDIFFYKQYRDKQVRGRIRCAAATVEKFVPEDQLPFAFWLQTPRDKYHKKWLLQAASEDEFTSWKHAIEFVSKAYENSSAEYDATNASSDNTSCAVS